MDNKQKRTLLSLLYRTMLIISILCLFVTIFLCSQRIYKNVDSVMWLDITLICLSCVLFILCISDIVTTKKLDGKYALAKFYYTVILLTFISVITLSIYVWMADIEIVNYISYFLPIGLLIGAEIVQILSFITGLKLTGLSRRTTITLDSSSPAPNFDDEIELKKKLDALNRKLAIKKLQDEINDAEKKLDE